MSLTALTVFDYESLTALTVFDYETSIGQACGGLNGFKQNSWKVKWIIYFQVSIILEYAEVLEFPPTLVWSIFI